MRQDQYNYTPLAEPTLITEQNWAEDTLPLVAISTATFNHVNYIRDCIEGILIQKTTFSVRIVIFDDCSTDGTREIVKEYEEKYPQLIRGIYPEKNTWKKPEREEALKPRNEARNVAKYIALCEGDDYWTDPLKLQKQVDFMEANPEFSLCFHSINYYNNETNIIEKIYPEGLIKSEFSQENIAVSSFIPTPSVLFLNPKDRVFPTYSGLSIGDYPLYLFLSSYGKAKFLDFVGATYRFAVGSFSTLDKINQQRETKKMLDAVLEKDFLTIETRKRLEKQKLNYGTQIYKKRKDTQKYEDLLKAEKDFSNYKIKERLIIFIKSFL